MRLATVTIWVDDPHVLRDWYRDVLGFAVVQDTPRFVLLGGPDDPGTTIGFHVGEPVPTPERIQFHLEVDDVDAEYARLSGLGVEFEGPPEDRPWGVRSTAALDPAGHSVEITTPFRAAGR